MDSLTARAETILIGLTQLEAGQESAAAWNTIETNGAWAQRSREALQSDLDTVPSLEALGVSWPTLAQAKQKEVTQARTALRTTASNVVGVDDIATMAKRVSTETVNRSLKAAEQTTKWLITELNRAVNRRREELLPDRIDEPLVRYPGVDFSTFSGLQRAQTLLQKQVVDVSTAEQLRELLERIIAAAQMWEANRHLIDQAEQSEHPEVRDFLAAAATDDGAPWDSITPVVREWLSNEAHADGIRIHWVS
jgi:hypothetical protein